MKILSRNEYHLAFAHYILACELHRKSREHESQLEELIGSDSRILDSVYNPDSKGTKDELDKLLLDNGFTVDWKDKLKKEIPEESKEKDENVGG